MQTLTQDKRNRLATVYKVLQIWKAGGLPAIDIFLDDENTIISKDSWASKIKISIDNGHIQSVQAEIENLISKFKISE